MKSKFIGGFLYSNNKKRNSLLCTFIWLFLDHISRAWKEISTLFDVFSYLSDRVKSDNLFRERNFFLLFYCFRIVWLFAHKLKRSLWSCIFKYLQNINCLYDLSRSVSRVVDECGISEKNRLNGEYLVWVLIKSIRKKFNEFSLKQFSIIN